MDIKEFEDLLLEKKNFALASTASAGASDICIFCRLPACVCAENLKKLKGESNYVMTLDKELEDEEDDYRMELEELRIQHEFRMGKLQEKYKDGCWPVNWARLKPGSKQGPKGGEAGSDGK